MLRKLQSPTKIKRKIIGLLVLFIVLLTVFEIWSVNRLATYGVQINKLEEAKASLKMENQVLQNQVAQKSSLLQIGQKTKALGFEKVKKIEYLPVDGGLALNR